MCSWPTRSPSRVGPCPWRWAATPERRGKHASAVVYGYFAGLAHAGYAWHYRPGVSVGVIPTNDALACVFVSTPSAAFHRERQLAPAAFFREVLSATSPELAEAVGRAELTEPLRAFAGRPGVSRRASGPGWALVGDAGWFRDPISANGISEALLQSEMLAQALSTGTEAALADYLAQREEACGPLFDVTDRIASFAWDLDALRALHHDLRRCMAAQTRALSALHARPHARLPLKGAA